MFDPDRSQPGCPSVASFVEYITGCIPVHTINKLSNKANKQNIKQARMQSNMETGIHPVNAFTLTRYNNYLLVNNIDRSITEIELTIEFLAIDDVEFVGRVWLHVGHL